LNQAHSLIKAGLEIVEFYGIIGEDGEWMLKELKDIGFPTKGIKIDSTQVNVHV